MSAMVFTGQKLYGLFELDAVGTVLYSRLEGDGKADHSHAEFDGLCFFDAAPLGNAEEFRRVVSDFRESDAPALSVVITCVYGDGPEQVRVLLARVREQLDRSRTKSTLVHIKKA